jgi:hypothetical protein
MAVPYDRCASEAQRLIAEALGWLRPEGQPVTEQQAEERRVATAALQRAAAALDGDLPDA